MRTKAHPDEPRTLTLTLSEIAVLVYALTWRGKHPADEPRFHDTAKRAQDKLLHAFDTAPTCSATCLEGFVPRDADSP